MINQQTPNPLYGNFTTNAGYVSFPFRRRAPMRQGHIAESFRHITTDSSYNKGQYPVIFPGHHEVHDILRRFDYQPFAFFADISLDPMRRRFRVSPQLRVFSDIIASAIQNLEATISLETIANLKMHSQVSFVPWKRYQFVGGLHADGGPFKLFRHKVRRGKLANCDSHIAYAYPFPTHFISSLSARNVGSLKKTYQLGSVRFLPSSQSPENHFYAWATPHVHLAQPMPPNRIEAERILSERIPNFPTQMIYDHGLLRFWLSLTVTDSRPKKARLPRPLRKPIHHRRLSSRRPIS